MAVADSAKRNVVRHYQTNRGFNLVDARPKHRPINGSRRDRAVDDMIDLVILEREYLRKSAANLVEHGHCNQSLSTIQTRHLRGGDGDRVKIVVAEFAGGRFPLGVVSKICAVAVPLAYGRRASEHCLFRRNGNSAAKHWN